MERNGNKGTDGVVDSTGESTGLTFVGESSWTQWPGTGLAGRDLGLSVATAGAYSAQRIKADGDDVKGGEWHCYDLAHEFVYVCGGMLELESADGQVHQLTTGSGFFHPAFWWHRDLFRSGDLDVVRVTSPAQGLRFDGRSTVLPPAASLPSVPATYITKHESTDLADKSVSVRSFSAALLGEERVLLQEVTLPPGGIRPFRGTWTHVVAGDVSLKWQQDEAERLTIGDSLTFEQRPGAATPHITTKLGGMHLELKI